jgi:regulator of CtrA degradation
VNVHTTLPPKETGATAFFSGTYDEAIEMLVQTRDYLTSAGDKDCALLSSERQKIFAFESLRLTSRLTRIMAWLLAQRAVHKGQMSIDEALDEGFCLRNVAVCVEKGSDIAFMPEGLRALLERSHRLYVRVSRLDDMVRRERLPALANSLIGTD